MKKPTTPPSYFLRFFRWFCHPKLRDFIEGDLMELYDERIKQSGKRKADIKFIIDVLLLLRPGIIKPSQPWQSINNYAMLRSYFTIGWRNLLKNKGYSAINIGGLAMGMTVAMLIGLWVYDEFSYNRYHTNYGRIAQFMKSGVYEGTPFSGGVTLQYPLIAVLKTDYADNFKHIVEALKPADYILSSGETKISRKGQFMAEGVAEMLSLEMTDGTWDGLHDPHSIFLATSTAKALFGDADPMGRLLKINNDMDVKVTGVYRDLPHNTAFRDIKFFAPWELIFMHSSWIKEQPWDNHFLSIYCEIAPNTSFDEVNAKIADAEIKEIRNMENMKEQIDKKPRIGVLPMSDWHLFADYSKWPNYGVPDSGPLRFVILIGMIGAFVLFLACINFMNLSTARSEKRAREVGIRKSMGSARGQLISQFFSESYLVVVFSFILAIAFASLTLPWFNVLTSKEMSMPWTSQWFWLSSLIFVLITGLLAGSYPALYLSSFNPVKVLKGTFRSGNFTSLSRKVLVVTQFTVSVTLIICTLIVYDQIVFAMNRPVGYTREGLIIVQKRSNDFYGKTTELRNELKKTGVVEEIAESGGKVTNVWSGNGGFSWSGKDPNIDPQFGTLSVTPGYGKTVGWQFVGGRDFSNDGIGDSAGIVINETAAKLIGLEHPVGEIVHWTNKNWNMDKDFTVIGIVKDMVMDSPYEPIEPAVFFLQGWFSYFNIRIRPGVRTDQALPKIEAVFRKVIPAAPFEYEFASQEYALKFAAEEQIGKLAAVFSVLAILISCLGIFGLASFVAEQRTKELGIRKVLGASITQLWKLLSKDFVVLVMLACFIAIPVSLYFMSDWLTHYKYRTDISWETFALVTLGALAITLVTVSYQAIRAALANPVNSLRSE